MERTGQTPSESGVNGNLNPTLRDIAKATGHAVSTVSCALRGEPGVSRKVSERIRGVATTMGWRPNPLVSAWLSHVRQARHADSGLTLAYVISSSTGIEAHLSSPIFNAYHQGASQRAASLGFHLECFHYESFGGQRLSRILVSRGIPALIVAPLEEPGKPLSIDWPAFACATIAYSLEAPCLHRAANHHQHSVTLAIDKLRKLGYRRIGLAIPADIDTRSSHMFSGGFWAAATHFSFPPVPPFLPEHHAFSQPDFLQWLQQFSLEALIGTSQTRRWLQNLPRHAPQPSAFADLDLKPGAAGTAGIDQKPRLIGAAAVDLATSQLFRNERGVPADPKLILVESRWRDGPSAPAHPSAPPCVVAAK